VEHALATILASITVNALSCDYVGLQARGLKIDIVPLHPFARSLANVEAIIGQLYPATLLARLVRLELEGRRR
jgi:hypothetical protein